MFILRHPGLIPAVIILILALYLAYFWVHCDHYRGHLSIGFKLSVVPICAVLCFALAMTALRGNFVMDNANYVVTRHNYQASVRSQKSAKRQLDHDSRRLKRFPDLKLHNPKIGNMTLNQFDRYSIQRQHLQRVVQSDQHTYYLSRRNTMTHSVTTASDVRRAKLAIKHDGRDAFVRHTKLRHRALPYFEHEFRHHPNQVKKES